MTDQRERSGTGGHVRWYRTVSTNLHANKDYDVSQLVFVSGGPS